jgi:uncharacterized protein (TIGR04255 family)
VAHGDDLLRKPLVEAVFELRWKLTGGPFPSAPLVDPNYKLLVGSLYEKVREGGYPFHEQLPTATVPDEFVPYLIQHRFRRTEGGYPLVQVGPGIFAVNDTADYSWKTHLRNVLEAVGRLRETYAGELTPESFLLRYINAVPFDFSTGDVFEYLRESLKVSVAYPHQLFTEQPAEQRPNTVILETRHSLTKPTGEAALKFTAAEVSGTQHLAWETLVQSSGSDVPPLDGLEPWLQQAHDVARAWFFTLIEGKLETEFNT